MPPLVSAGAMVSCSMAMPTVQVPLATTPKSTEVNVDTPAASVDDYVPLTNIPTFGMCGAIANPAVAAATAAKSGAFTPAPCTPAVSTPWTPGATRVKVGGQPALHGGCQAICAWGGVITISSPGNEGRVQVS
ncbi:MAG TPA: DUF4280 domain-containing protein [Solirubrobacteraceae bacterium]|nr:DUF4280 domain-containing protein [Solirubrobacteraceae bacterium]